jgi:hypothetical protein
MRNALQTDRFAHVRPVGDYRDNATMVDLQRRHQDQQRKELRLREVPATVPAGVSRKCPFGNLDGLPGQRHRRLGHRTCGFHERSF